MLGIGLGSQPTTECGIFGTNFSLSLDGNSDFVSTPSGLLETLNTQQFTLSCWVNLVQNDGDTSQWTVRWYIDSNNNGGILYHKTHTEWRGSYKCGGTAMTSVYDIPGSSNNDGSGYDDGWQHFAVVCSNNNAGSSSVNLYRNGTSAGATAGDTNVSTSDLAQFHIGAGHDSTSAFLDGYIDQVSIHNSALDSNAITAIYNGGVPRDLTTFHTNYSPRALIAYYQFENDVVDSSLNGFDGQLNGTAGFNSSQPDD